MRKDSLTKLQMRQIRDLSDLARFGSLSLGIFHDLMTPLNAVIASVEQLKDDPSRLPEAREHLARAVAASRRLGSYLSGIRGQMRSHQEQREFSPGTEIDDACAILAYKARMARVALVKSIRFEGFLVGNPLSFQRIVQNLVANAIDSYGETSASLSRRLVRITISKKEGFLLTEVSDQGKGMSPETLSRVFEPFFTTKKRSEGLGIGLSSTKETVEREFRGTISATSIPGQGSNFSVIIPLRNHRRTK